MALIAGASFFLNLVPGSVLQYLHFRWGLLASQILFIAGPAIMAVRWFYLDRAAVLPFIVVRSRWLVATLAGAVGLNHLLTVAMIWQERFFPQPRILRALLENFLDYRDVLDLSLLLILAAGIVPVCEEILFRGFLQSGLIRLMESAPKGIVAGAFVFAAFHLDPWRFIATLTLGLWLGFLAHRSGSLLPPIAAHAVNNLLAITLTEPGSGLPRMESSIISLVAAGALVLMAFFVARKRAAGREATGML
ncbi:MAG: CPBP family intramembrane metalloprotease [Acidobacteria bacterium]|nr:CPBP family intramembrane metalloprotease [Acidobacteriota bacterium]